MWLCLACMAVRLGLQRVCAMVPCGRLPVAVEEPNSSHTSSPMKESSDQAAANQVHICTGLHAVCIAERQLQDCLLNNHDCGGCSQEKVSTVYVYIYRCLFANVPHTSLSIRFYMLRNSEVLLHPVACTFWCFLKFGYYCPPSRHSLSKFVVTEDCLFEMEGRIKCSRSSGYND